jgi:hypothetical protein
MRLRRRRTDPALPVNEELKEVEEEWAVVQPRRADRAPLGSTLTYNTTN